MKKNREQYSLFYLAICWIFFSPISVSAGTWSIEKFDAIELGISSEKAKQVFGAPEKKLRKVEGETAVSEIWIYRQTVDGGASKDLIDRVTLEFNVSDRKMVSKGFSVFESDPVHDLSGVRRRYSDAQFTHREAPFCGHYQLSEDLYTDWSKGLSVIESRRTRKISQIGRWIAGQRKPDTEPDRCKSTGAHVEELND